MAFAITYEELSHHGFGRGELLRRSAATAGATALFFLAVVALAGWWLANVGLP